MGKVVIITGASAGMGATTAKYLAERGYQVFGASRRATTGNITNGFTELQMDVTNEQSVAAAVGYVIDQVGRIDVLVNNAGIGLIGSIEDTSDAEARGVFDTNVFGLLNVSRAVTPYMREAGTGTIINISSIAGVMGLPYRGIYSASKAAVIAITEAMSAEVKKYNVRVSALLPGDFKTSINENRRVVANALTSNYKTDTEHLNRFVTDEVASSGDPIVIAKRVEQIASGKAGKMLYQVGAPMQKLSTVLHYLLPKRWFEQILLNHYKLK